MKINILMLVVPFVWISCADLDFNSENIVGLYEGKLVFLEQEDRDTVHVETGSFEFFEDGNLIYENLTDMETDTLEWFLNESANKLTFRKLTFFGST